MANFTVRVELHDAEWKHYNMLHEQMFLRAFTNTITSDDGITYELPPAEYNFEGNATRAQVLTKAKEAASNTGKKYSILVTESTGRTWSNLEKV